MPEVVAFTHKPSTGDVEISPPVGHLNFHVLSMALAVWALGLLAAALEAPDQRPCLRKEGVWLLRDDLLEVVLESSSAHIVYMCALTNMYLHTQNT